MVILICSIDNGDGDDENEISLIKQNVQQRKRKEKPMATMTCVTVPKQFSGSFSFFRFWPEFAINNIAMIVIVIVSVCIVINTVTDKTDRCFTCIACLAAFGTNVLLKLARVFNAWHLYVPKQQSTNVLCVCYFSDDIRQQMWCGGGVGDNLALFLSDSQLIFSTGFIDSCVQSFATINQRTSHYECQTIVIVITLQPFL